MPGFAASCSVGGEPCVSFTQSSNFQTIVTPMNGEIGMFLIGTWDNRCSGGAPQPCFTDVASTVRLSNPSPIDLWGFVTFWKNDQSPLACVPLSVSSNGYADTTVGDLVTNPDTLVSGDHGAIKVLVINSDGNMEFGLVGYRTRDEFFGIVVESEIRLQPVPSKVLRADLNADTLPDELEKIICLCQPNNPLATSCF